MPAVRSRSERGFSSGRLGDGKPLLAIEVDGFAFHENNPDQSARDALKDEILDAHQIPLLRLPTTGSRELQQIRQALDNAEAHWARLSSR